MPAPAADAGSARATDPPPGGPRPLDDATLDEIARRVADRLAGTVVPDVIRDAVRTQVLDVAERLVREEIERIKARG